MKTDDQFHVLSLRTNGVMLRGGEVLLDGKLLKGLKAIKIEASVESAATVTLEMIANVDYQGEVRKQ